MGLLVPLFIHIIAVSLLGGFAAAQCSRTTPPCHLVCHCQSGSQCLVRGCGTAGCQRGWDGPMCQRENVVLGFHNTKGSRDTLGFSSSRERNSASLAFDGKQKSFRTEKEHSPYLWVNLGSVQTVYALSVNTTAHDFQIFINSIASLDRATLCKSNNATQATGTTRYDVTCYQPLDGQYVWITRPGNRVLRVTEMDIYRCSDYWFGVQCDKPCNCQTRNEVCNKATGGCSSGCPTGYTPPDCQETASTDPGLNTNPASTPGSLTGNSSNQGAIAGGVVGALVIILLLAGIGFILFRKRKQRRENANPPKGFVNKAIQDNDIQTSADDDHYYSIDEFERSRSSQMSNGGHHSKEARPKLEIPGSNETAEYSHLKKSAIPADQLYNTLSDQTEASQSNSHSFPEADVTLTDSTGGDLGSGDDNNTPYFVLENDTNIQPQAASDSEDKSDGTTLSSEANNPSYFVLESNKSVESQEYLKNSSGESPLFGNEKKPPNDVSDEDKGDPVNEDTGYFILENDKRPDDDEHGSNTLDNPNDEPNSIQTGLTEKLENLDYNHLDFGESSADNYSKLSPDFTTSKDGYFVLE